MRYLSGYRTTFLLAVGLAVQSSVAVRAADDAKIMRSVIRIQATALRPDYRVPWNAGVTSNGLGTGFVIGGKWIMTNAHVISNARFIGVENTSTPRVFPAQVRFVAHDCDLAILEVEDESFFGGLVPLQLGDVPELDSTVGTYGYPIGGKRMSVTRGVVSRIEFRPYAHSALDAHLAIQTDAAINPGNSGGPVIQNGKVVGVAFQGLSGAVAQNTGYMIPTPVIKRFLADVEDGRYDGYPELGVSTFNLQNPAARARLGLADNNRGVLVTSVMEAASAKNLLQRGDVLLTIDGHEIMSDAQIQLDGEMIQMVEIVERKFKGDVVTFTLLRDGKEQEVKVTLTGAWPYAMQAHRYDRKPRYLIFAGLVFQPLHLDFLGAYGVKDPEILDVFHFFISDELYKERPQPIVLSAILSDPVNTHYDSFKMALVEEVNGVNIGSLRQLDTVLGSPAERYVFRLAGRGKPMVIEADSVAEVNERVSKQYGVPQLKHLGDEDQEVTK